MKIVYLGYDALFPALEEIASQGCDLLELFTCRTDNITEYNHQVIEFAKRNGLPYHLDPITLEDLHRLEQVGCELILCAGYYHRIPTDTSIAMVNIHPSLLPHGRGAWPMPHAILNQDTTTGLSLHKLSERFDQGD
ncbi:MAG: formyltransferase family protein [Eubacteriales bacterium]